MPNVLGGYQPDTRSSSARRADFDLLRRVSDLERSLQAVIGDISAAYSFTFNSSTAEPPIGNQIRLNNASQLAATKAWATGTTTEGLDVSTGLARIRATHQIYMQDFDDAALWVKYTVSAAPIDKGTYWEFPITYHSGPGTVPFQKVMTQVVYPQAVA